MDALTLTQSLLQATACPECGAKALDLKLRCDLGFGECLYTATCTGCEAHFTVVKPAPGPILADSCPRCGARRLERTLRCETRNGECETVWVCPGCEAVPRAVGAA